MSKIYKFKITGQKRESYLPDMKERITISVSAEELKSTSFFFSLKLHKDSKVFEIEDISLKYGPSWQHAELMGYLQGKFNFDSEKDIERALLELKNNFNHKEYCIEIFHSSWRELHIQFAEWFLNEFQPYLDNQIKSHEILLNINKEC